MSMGSEATSNGLYLIKGKFYGNIVKCQKGTYYGNPILKITFAKGATLNYNPADVTCFPYTRTIDGDFRVKSSSDQYYISSRIHIYGKDQAYGIESKKGFVNYVLARDAQIESSLLAYGTPKVFGYLSLLSEISTIDTGDGSMTSLRQKYDNVKYLFKGSLLASYCKPELYKSEEPSCPLMIFPFGCNESQYNAVRNALENRLSVIQGPPGTGKTQTILNIIANLLLYGKNCLIVSNNNSAVSNVVEKLSQPKYGLDFLVASLGKIENKEEFIKSQTGELPEMSSWEISALRESELRSEVRRIEKGLKSYFESQSKLAEFIELEAELRYQMELSDTDATQEFRRNTRLTIGSTASLYKLLLQYDSEIQRYGKLRLLTRLKAFFYGLNIADRTQIERLIQEREYEEVVSSIESLKKSIALFENSYNKYQNISLEFLKSFLANKFGKQKNRKVMTGKMLNSMIHKTFSRIIPLLRAQRSRQRQISIL